MSKKSIGPENRITLALIALRYGLEDMAPIKEPIEIHISRQHFDYFSYELSRWKSPELVYSSPSPIRRPDGRMEITLMGNIKIVRDWVE